MAQTTEANFYITSQLKQKLLLRHIAGKVAN